VSARKRQLIINLAVQADIRAILLNTDDYWSAK